MAPLIRKKKAKVEKPTTSISASSISVLSREDNPFLHQAKTTKKEKREQKRDILHDRLKSSTYSGISKSSLKRQKKKAKSNLNSNLTDLLSTLPITSETNDKSASIITTSSGYIQTKPKLIDPKKSSKKNEKVVKEEISRFNKVLAEKTFRKSPFDTLKSFINSNIEKKEEFIKLEKKHKEAQMDI